MNKFGQFVCDSGSICNPVENLKNKYIYINQNVPKVTRVLINPNFKPTIHINPNFQHNQVPIVKTIHVNPVILDANRKLYKNINNNKNHTNNSLNISPESKYPKYISCNNNKKLIRTSLLKTTVSATKKKIDTSSKTYISNNLTKTNISKFKVDRRTKPLNTSGKQKTECNISTRFVFIKNAKLNKTKYIKLNGKLYKYSRNKSLITSTAVKNVPVLHKMIDKHKKQKIYSILRKYKLNSNLKYIKDDHVSKQNIYKFITKNDEKTKNSAGEKKLKLRRSSIKRQNMEKLKKCNMPCEIYQRYGKCAKKDLGRCLKIHKPEQVALCTKFLRGACVDNNCLLSHNLAPEKMPTCNYFLEGRCLKDDCPYLHVKVSAKADICKDFLVGYCKLAKECLKRHQYLCPDFEKYNICKKTKCPYPHGNIVRNINLLNEVTKGIEIVKKVSSNKEEKLEENCSVGNNDKKTRYYVNHGEDANANITGKMLDVKDKLIRREKIGSLPTYIPFLNSSN